MNVAGLGCRAHDRFMLRAAVGDAEELQWSFDHQRFARHADLSGFAIDDDAWKSDGRLRKFDRRPPARAGCGWVGMRAGRERKQAGERERRADHVLHRKQIRRERNALIGATGTDGNVLSSDDLGGQIDPNSPVMEVSKPPCESDFLIVEPYSASVVELPASTDDRRRSDRRPARASGWISGCNDDRSAKGSHVLVNDLSMHGIGFYDATMPYRTGACHWLVVNGGALRLSTRIKIVSCRENPNGGFDVGARFF